MNKLLTITLLLFIVNFNSYVSSDILEDKTENKSFSLELLDDSVALTRPGNIVEIASRITNLTKEDLYINIKRIEVIMPNGWSTQFCAKGCFPPEVSSRTMYFSPEESDYFGVYVATGNNEGIATIKFSFENKDNPNECFYQTYIVKSYSFNDIIKEKEQKETVIYYSNNKLIFNIQANKNPTEIILSNILGQVIYYNNIFLNFDNGKKEIELPNLYHGFYILTIRNGMEIETYKFIY